MLPPELFNLPSLCHPTGSAPLRIIGFAHWIGEKSVLLSHIETGMVYSIRSPADFRRLLSLLQKA